MLTFQTALVMSLAPCERAAEVCQSSDEHLLGNIIVNSPTCSPSLGQFAARALKFSFEGQAGIQFKEGNPGKHSQRMAHVS